MRKSVGGRWHAVLGTRKRTRVVAPSSGCASHTRLHLTANERALLAAVGEHLSVMRVADLRSALAGEKANDRAKRLMREFGVSSRYAETACADNDSAVKAARECLWNRRASLRGAIARLERRTAAPSRRACGCGPRRGCESCRDGYATENERIHKRRRLDMLRGELARVEQRLADKRHALTLGTSRLLNTRHHLTDAGMTEEQWRERWTAQRSFFGAIGNSGKPGGNPCLTLTVDEAGALRLTISVPRPVAERLGVPTRVQLTHPVPWRFCGLELRERVAQRTSTRFDVEHSVDRRGRPAVFLRASWQRVATEPVTLERARAGGVVGVDFNADHLAAWRLDPAGNPVGAPRRIPLEVKGQPAAVRDHRLREALTAVIDYAADSGASAVAIEDLGFTDAETSRESYGRRKSFRHLVASFATTQLRERLP